jgi:uncharacterized protein YdcH (DUF465 family)
MILQDKERAKIDKYLMETDSEYRAWKSQHQRLNEESALLTGQSYLIPADQKRLTEIKRQKLIIKDELEKRIEQAHRMKPGWP